MQAPQKRKPQRWDRSPGAARQPGLLGLDRVTAGSAKPALQYYQSLGVVYACGEKALGRAVGRVMSALSEHALS